MGKTLKFVYSWIRRIFNLPLSGVLSCGKGLAFINLLGTIFLAGGDPLSSAI